MKKIYEDLFQTTVYKSGHLKTYAYYLKMPYRNVLIYNTNNEEDLTYIENAGTLHLQCLSHRHEVSNSILELKNRFNHEIFIDEAESDLFLKDLKIRVNSNKEQIEDEDFELFHTPGHTSGGISYYYKSKVSGLNYLFTGDTYFLWDSVLSTLVLKNEGGSKDELIKSLEFYKTLSPDVIIPSASLGEDSYIHIEKDIWLESLDKSIEKLRSK